MKIDTLEKLEILHFGLNAGRELGMGSDGASESGALTFGDAGHYGFNIDRHGNLEPGAYCLDHATLSTESIYTVKGCLQYSKEDAATWFGYISKKGGAEDASNS